MTFQTRGEPGRCFKTSLLPFLTLFLCLCFNLGFDRDLRAQGVVGPRRNGSIALGLLKPTPVPFQHTIGASGKRYVVEPMTAGLALFDYDGDGFIDVYFVNGAPLPGTPKVDPQPTNRLYRNLGDWHFVDVTEAAHVGDTGYGLGVAAGDIDNDGDPDIYVSNFEKDVFFLNNGDGTFTEAATDCGLDDGNRFGAGVCMLDIDNDGNLDIYCANYQYFTFDKHFQQTIGDYQYHPGPHDFPPADDLLFHSSGDGTFTDVSASCGIRVKPAPGMGVVSADFDGNGAADILVANDSFPNFLFLNDGTGKFSEEALIAGVALDRLARPNGNMGVDCGDVDNDGMLDIFTTTYQDEMPVLYQQVAPGVFEDTTNRAKIASGMLPHVTWGLGIVDFDNDADKDIYVACGHFLDNIQHLDDRTSVKVNNFVMENNGRGVFEDVTEAVGAAVEPIESSRGAAFDDLNNDGLIDIVVINSDSAPSFIENRSPAQHWIAFELVGTQSSRDAAGAIVRVRTDLQTQMAVVHLGRSYQSHFGTRLHFGLGKQTAGEVEIRWPSGTVQKSSFSEANQVFRIIED
jgi:enediyne biosynthesis protein E4